MPFLTTSKTRAPRYDAIVVGSGAAGGMAAYVLAKAGAKVLMLEAGRNYDPVTETPMFQSQADAPLRGVSTPEKPNGFFDATIGGWVVPGEPYVVRDTANDAWTEGTVQNRMKTVAELHVVARAHARRPHEPLRAASICAWGRAISSRAARTASASTGRSLTRRSRRGTTRWMSSPASTARRKVCRMIPTARTSSPPPKPRAYELLLQRGGKKLGIPVIASRMAILTKPLPGRSPCFYATPCGRGCAIKANFQSPTVLIPPALETGNLDIITDAMAREVTLDAQGRATGVHFIDKQTGQGRARRRARRHPRRQRAARPRASCSTRSPRNFRKASATSTGHLGRWLTDSTGSNLGGQIPALENMPLHNEDGTSSMHTYAPFSEAQAASAKAMGSPRGYYMAWGGGRQMPDMGTRRARRMSATFSARS